MRKFIVLACVAGTSYYLGMCHDYWVACAKAGYKMGTGEAPFEPYKTAERIYNEKYKS